MRFSCWLEERDPELLYEVGFIKRGLEMGREALGQAKDIGQRTIQTGREAIGDVRQFGQGLRRRISG